LELEEGEEIIEDEYMKFDDWWVEFINLRELLDTKLNNTQNQV
jgi:hypothetical protein